MSRRIPGVFVPSDAGLPAIAPATASGGAPATAGQSTKIPSHIQRAIPRGDADTEKRREIWRAANQKRRNASGGGRHQLVQG